MYPCRHRQPFLFHYYSHSLVSLLFFVNFPSTPVMYLFVYFFVMYSKYTVWLMNPHITSKGRERYPIFVLLPNSVLHCKGQCYYFLFSATFNLLHTNTQHCRQRIALKTLLNQSSYYKKYGYTVNMMSAERIPYMLLRISTKHCYRKVIGHKGSP